ncbi:MAG: MvaI/BcnI family restriction endonuclease [Pyrinomonadaceae bacterium]
MSANLEKIRNEFLRIKSLGFIKSNRTAKNDGAIGNTFEDYLGVRENNLKDPDFEGFEVKSKKELTTSYLSLFTKSPSHPKAANAFLKNKFGQSDGDFPALKKLNSSIFGHRWNSLYGSYKMKLEVDKREKKLILLVNDYNDNLISNAVYWSFEELEKAASKISSLFFVSASTNIIEDVRYFHYNSAKVFLNFDFDKFLTAIKNGKIMFDIRIGSYKSGKNLGKPHDHGSSFRVKRENIGQLYERELEIEEPHLKIR